MCVCVCAFITDLQIVKAAYKLTAIISLNNANCLVLKLEMFFVLCEVRFK